jgi:hypothetical protein
MKFHKIRLTKTISGQLPDAIWEFPYFNSPLERLWKDSGTVWNLYGKSSGPASFQPLPDTCLGFHYFNSPLERVWPESGKALFQTNPFPECIRGTAAVS